MNRKFKANEDSYSDITEFKNDSFQSGKLT
jgi:hypothetical protein